MIRQALPLALAVWIGLCGCRPAGNDTGNPDSGSDADLCDPVEGPGGTVAGVVDCTDGVCEVPAGTFWMGSATPEAPDRCPVREVELSAFAIDLTEVTLHAWTECAEDGVCAEASEACHSEVAAEDPDAQPVTCVDHSEATAFCEWGGGRLPTEAEWEKAARGTDGAPLPWGDAHLDCLHANYRFSASYCNLGVIEVGSYAEYASPFGLLDVAGNAWEWVADAYDEEEYATSDTVDPTGPDCEEDCAFRVMRGGAYNTTEDTLHTAARSFTRPDVVDDNMGFRCAYDR